MGGNEKQNRAILKLKLSTDGSPEYFIGSLSNTQHLLTLPLIRPPCCACVTSLRHCCSFPKDMYRLPSELQHLQVSRILGPSRIPSLTSSLVFGCLISGAFTAATLFADLLSDFVIEVELIRQRRAWTRENEGSTFLERLLSSVCLDL